MQFQESQARTVWLTDNGLAGDLVADHLSVNIISIFGFEGWRATLAELIERLRDGGRIVIALAPSWRKTPSIELDTWDLAQVGHAHSFQVEVASWDPQYPSLGEAWAAGIRPQLQTFASLTPPKWHYKSSSRILASLPSLEAEASAGLAELRALLEAGLRQSFR